MKNAWKWLALVLALVLIITLAYILYSKFSDKITGNNLIMDSDTNPTVENPAVTTQSGETADTTREPSKFTAPDFTVYDYDGKPVKLSDMRGKPVVINFWASWCPPCKAEMPDFEEMYKKYGDEIVFMMVNMTDGDRETVELAKKHVENNKFTFPVYFDTEMSAAYTYYVTSLPATYFIDADGNLITHAIGMINAATLERGIEFIK